MRIPLPLAILLLTLAACNSGDPATETARTETEVAESAVRDRLPAGDLRVYPVSHASFVLSDGNFTIYNDPVGGAGAYTDFDRPDLILLSDIHGDHLDSATLAGIVTGETAIIAPQAVASQLSPKLADQTTVLANGATAEVKGLSVHAVPMYNLREEALKYHEKGRGNGYVFDFGGETIYIAGDTEDIPEMRALTGIDRAFVPMNLPYTMPVAAAADAVVAFAPRVVHPYHYRGTEGLSDTAAFRQAVAAGGKDIDVIGLDWYPERG